MVNKEELIEIVKNSMSYANVCKKIGISSVGGNFNKIKKYIKLYEINIDHFTGQGWNTGDRYKFFGKLIPLDKILQGEHPTFSTTHLRERLIKEGLKEEKCEICKIINWNNKKISFHLDHIDGDNTNHKLDNLRILCPNCHSQTDTYGNKRKRNKNNYQSKLELLTAIYNSKNYTEVKKRLNLSRNGDNNFIKNILFNYNVKFTEKEKIQNIILKEIEFNNINKLEKDIIKRVGTNNILKNYCKCGKEIKNNSKTCVDCYAIKQRKVENRPSKNDLVLMIKETSMEAVGKKYGVSGNAVKKWLK
jgi:5-methylcytosine-specific restriction endonuclease McrA